MFEFLELDVPEDTLVAAARLVVPSPNIGRWRTADLEMLNRPHEDICDALQLFGYETEPGAPASYPASSADATRQYESVA